MTTERLLEIKKQIKNAKTTQSEVRGQISIVEERMEKKFKVRTASAAEKILKKMDAELTKLEAAMKKGLEELEEKYQWD